MRVSLGALFVTLLFAPTSGQATGPFTFYFEPGRSHLTPLHENTLNYAATWLRSVRARGIILEASADRVGSARSNMRLSQRRGEAVRQGLIRLGFPAAEISIRAFGESRPLIETPDGVAERQNRFVMIFIEGMGAGAEQPAN